jgi:hypothetical protein
MTDILDIESVILSPWSRFYPIGVWLLILLLCLAIGLFLYFRFRHLWTKIKKLAPYDRAEKELQALEKVGMLDAKHGGEFYFKLTEILKRYFEDEFYVSLVDKTTDEILSLREGLSAFLETSEKERFQSFLLKSDSIKFAKMSVPPEEAGRDLAWVRALINEAHVKALKRQEKVLKQS